MHFLFCFFFSLRLRFRSFRFAFLAPSRKMCALCKENVWAFAVLLLPVSKMRHRVRCCWCSSAFAVVARNAENATATEIQRQPMERKGENEGYCLFSSRPPFSLLSDARLLRTLSAPCPSTATIRVGCYEPLQKKKQSQQNDLQRIFKKSAFWSTNEVWQFSLATR